MNEKRINAAGNAPICTPDSRFEAPESETAGAGATNIFDRYITHFAIINFSFCLQAAWEGMALTFQFAWLNGGPAALVYGCIVSGIGSTAVAASLGEMASMDPAVGAQYRWSARFARRDPEFWAFMQGWITTFAWICNVGGAMSVLANTTSGLIIFNNPQYEPQRWHMTVLLIGFTLTMTLLNLGLRRVLNPLENIGGLLHILLFIGIVAVLGCLSPRSDSKFVFNTLTTESGWDNPGVAWSIGLLTTAYPISSFDSVLHMIDETKEPRQRAPYAMVYSTVLNAIMMFAFSICLLYCIGDVEAVTRSSLPLVEIFYSATNSKAVSTALVLLTSSVIVISCFNVVASVSRLVWAFAKDNGVPFGRHFVHIHPKLQVPVPALVLVAIVCCFLSLIHFGSAVAFNALIALPMIALYISYLIPIVLLTLRQIAGEQHFYGPWRLGRWSVPIKVFSICYLVYVIIFIPFPTVRPVTSLTMNYAGPVLLGIIVIALLDWFTTGRRRFRVPTTAFESGEDDR
ncbi:amino acid/polyamine transporter I [Pyrenochaeta sp. MPI-SDFR-AT-0127]|nr:amino acid/polyamine transporter I [Pyrenochaeta sp. MPI-SDFR-AT-0127]